MKEQIKQEQIKQFEKAMKEFGLKLDYSEFNGNKYLEIFSKNGEHKHCEWCKYEDGEHKYR